MKTLVKCPHCASDLEVEGAGRFQCHECGQNFTVGDDAPPVMTEPPKPRVIVSSRQEKDRGAGWWTIFKVIGALILIPSLIFFAGTMVMLFTEDNKGVGIAAVFISIIPAGIGSMLYAIGANAGKETICGNCGENVGKHALICKTCQARLAG